MRNILRLLLVAVAICMTACEKVVLDEAEEVAQQPVENNGDEDAGTPQNTTSGNLVLRVVGFNVVPFDTRATENIADYCTRLNFVVYREGKKVKAITQKKGEASYGQVAMELDGGDYQVLVVAHSSEGNPSLATPTKIQFTNDDGFSDTFYYYGDVSVSDEQKQQDVMLERVTSMLRFTTEDPVPATVKQMRLYFTGGSGALDATTGFGCVNSQQCVFFDITSDMVGKPLTMETYTILKAETAKLDLIVTAYATDEAYGGVKVLVEKEFKTVPMERNKITQYSGWFFAERPQTEHNFQLVADTEWGGQTNVSY